MRAFHGSTHEIDAFSVQEHAGPGLAGSIGIFVSDHEIVAREWAEDLGRKCSHPRYCTYIYDVEIYAAPETFLVLDAPMGEQPEIVKAALAPIDVPAGALGRDALIEVAAWMAKQAGDLEVPLIKMLPKVAAFLRDSGVSGVRFSDSKDKTYKNYAVFDGQLIEIVSKKSLLE